MKQSIGGAATTAQLSAAVRRNARSTPAFGFFRFHGVWAPGVRLFRAVGFRVKACIIALTFLLPMAMLGVKYFSNQATQIDFSAKEREGVQYTRELIPLLTMLQRQRLLAVQAAAKGGATPGLTEVREAVAAQLPKLAALEQSLGSALGTAKTYTAFLESAKASATVGASADATFAAHSAHIQALLDLLGQVADGSNLTLDPDIDSYYLMDVAVFRLPVMLEAAAQVRGLGNAVLLANAVTTAQSRQIIEQMTLLKSNQAALEAGVDKAVAYNAAVRASVKPEDIKTQVYSFLSRVDATVLRIEGLQGDAASHVLLANSAIDAMVKLQAQSLDELDVLLAARVHSMEVSRNSTALVMVAGILTALYFFMSFQMVLDGGLKQVAFHIDAMRDGDLTSMPRAWGGDEVARLMGTLLQMQGSLRRIVTQVRGASDSIVMASTEISSGATDLSARTEQSAANLEKTASAMEEIASTVRNSEATLDEATRLAVANAQVAERGGKIIGEVVSTMQAINTSSSRIGDIVGTIDGIAFQTNILALNAAVEAARAGEQGRGFAVVASEVRALAQRSSAAAREIKGLISSSVEQVGGGMRVVQEAGTTIGEIVGTSQRLRELLADVVVGAREQTLGVAQTAKAVQDLDIVTQQNAALVEQTAAAAGVLQDRAHGLASEVAQFKLPAG